VVILWTAALAGCGVPARDRLVHVFFTGVDRPAAAANTTGAAGAHGPATPGTNAPVLVASLPREPVVHFHQPFADRNCSACHAGEHGQQLKAEGGDLCLGCHDKLIGQAKYVHPPVDDGKCLMCHEPHQSRNSWLLSRKGRAVCLECHRLAKMEKVKGHAEMGTAACQSCHDPHRSDLKKLLRAQP